MKCWFILIGLVPCGLCIVSSGSEGNENPSSGVKSSSLESRVSTTEQDKSKDLIAEQSIEHHHYDFPGGYGHGHGHGYGHGHDYGHGHGHGYYPGGYGGYGHGSDLALKTLLIPLAGAALIGAAAIFAYNPLLIQLGVVAGRKKRSTQLEENPLLTTKFREIQQIEKFIDQLPKERVFHEEKRLLASYLMCSGAGSGNFCLERLSCHMNSPAANSTSLDRTVLDIVTNQIMDNEFVPQRLKNSLVKATAFGKKSGDCKRFYCSQIDSTPLDL